VFCWFSSVADCEVYGVQHICCWLVFKYFKLLFAEYSVHKERLLCCWLLNAVPKVAGG